MHTKPCSSPSPFCSPSVALSSTEVIGNGVDPWRRSSGVPGLCAGWPGRAGRGQCEATGQPLQQRGLEQRVGYADRPRTPVCQWTECYVPGRWQAVEAAQQHEGTTAHSNGLIPGPESPQKSQADFHWACELANPACDHDCK